MSLPDIFQQECPFPDQLVGDILQVLRDDSKFKLDDMLRREDVTPEQIAMYAVYLTLSKDWRRWYEHMDRYTYEQIKHMVNSFTAEPSVEPEPVDPLAAQAQQMSEFDPWERQNAIHDPRYVTVIGDGDLGITDTRGSS